MYAPGHRPGAVIHIFKLSEPDTIPNTDSFRVEKVVKFASVI